MDLSKLKPFFVLDYEVWREEPDRIELFPFRLKSAELVAESLDELAAKLVELHASIVHTWAAGYENGWALYQIPTLLEFKPVDAERLHDLLYQLSRRPKGAWIEYLHFREQRIELRNPDGTSVHFPFDNPPFEGSLKQAEQTIVAYQEAAAKNEAQSRQ